MCDRIGVQRYKNRRYYNERIGVYLKDPVYKDTKIEGITTALSSSLKPPWVYKDTKIEGITTRYINYHGIDLVYKD